MQIFRYAILPQNFIQITELCVSRRSTTYVCQPSWE
jgi:hypothetical protein